MPHRDTLLVLQPSTAPDANMPEARCAKRRMATRPQQIGGSSPLATITGGDERAPAAPPQTAGAQGVPDKAPGGANGALEGLALSADAALASCALIPRLCQAVSSQPPSTRNARPPPGSYSRRRGSTVETARSSLPQKRVLPRLPRWRVGRHEHPPPISSRYCTWEIQCSWTGRHNGEVRRGKRGMGRGPDCCTPLW